MQTMSSKSGVVRRCPTSVHVCTPEVHCVESDITSFGVLMFQGINVVSTLAVGHSL